MTREQIDTRLPWWPAPTLFCTPTILDFGRIPCNQKVQRELYVTNIHGPIEPCTVLCHEENSWFRLITVQGMSGYEGGIVRVIMEADSACLTAGRCYQAWIEIRIAQTRVRVPLLVEIDALARLPVQATRRQRTLRILLLTALLLGGLLVVPVAMQVTAQTDQLLYRRLHLRSSADFTAIGFAAVEGATLTLQATNLTGGDLASFAVAGWSPAWSPDGEQLVFLSDQRGAVQLYRLPVAGGTPVALTSSAESKAAPVWSPDGSKLAYLAGSPDQSVLRVLDSHTFAWGNRATALIDNRPLIAAVNDLFRHTGQPREALGFTRHFAWSPTGQALLLDFYQRETVQLLHIDARGVVTVAATNSWSPAWSPDGKTVAAVSREGLFRFALGSNQRYYLSPRQAQAPAWSATGKQIAFLAPQTKPGDPASLEGHKRLALWLIDAIDGQETLLAHDCVAFAWAPDGRRLAYVTGDSKAADPLLYLWLLTPGAQPALLAEVGAPMIAWKPTP